MPNFTKFAIAGAGMVGGPIVKALRAQSPSATVRVLSRTADKVVEGVHTTAVDYSSPESIKAALEGVEVVICTFGMSPEMPTVQRAVADAAKAVGVQLFLPVEFGDQSMNQEGPLATKRAMQGYLKEIDLPYLLVFTGPFPEFVWTPFCDVLWSKRRVTIVGKGDTPIGYTHLNDVGFYVAKSLLTLPPSELAWSVIRTESFRLSLNEGVSLYETLHPDVNIAVSHVPLNAAKSQFEAAIKDRTQMLTAIKLMLGIHWEEGHTPYTDGPLISDRWLEHNKVTPEELLKGM